MGDLDATLETNRECVNVEEMVSVIIYLHVISGGERSTLLVVLAVVTRWQSRIIPQDIFPLFSLIYSLVTYILGITQKLRVVFH